MRKYGLVCLGLFVVSSAYGQNFSIKEGKLSNYTGKNAGNSFEVGDKVFSNFVYSETGSMPLAKDVNVLGGTDINGNFGFRLTGAFGTLPGTNSDAILSYTVTVDNSVNTIPLFITDAHLQGNPNVLGGNGSMSVTETFTDPTFNDDLSANTLSIFKNVPPGTAQNMNDTVFAASYSVLNVQKDIEALSAANKKVKGGFDDSEGNFCLTSSGTPTLSFIDQSFSQSPGSLTLPPPVEETPEPSSLILGIIGTISLLFRRTIIRLAI